jgi:hypothetical protein
MKCLSFFYPHSSSIETEWHLDSLMTWTCFSASFNTSGPNTLFSLVWLQNSGVQHRRPYSASNRAILILAWWLLLYENYAYGKLLCQLLPFFSTNALNKSSNIWLVLSVCPSVYGWYAKLKFSLVSMDSWSFSQNLDVNWKPLSDMIFGTPCKHMILDM